MSLSITQRLPTPSDEWAEHTAHALQSTSQARPVSAANTDNNGQVPFGMTVTPSIASSALSTPGLDIPGAFPKFKYPAQSTNNATSVIPNERSPHTAVDKLANAAPSKDFSDLDVDTLKKEAARLFEAAKQYAPETGQVREDITNAAGNLSGAVAQYIPEQEKMSEYLPTSAAKALGMSTNADASNASSATDVVADLDGTTPAKPEIIVPSLNDSDVDKASVRAIPPSTRSPSYQLDTLSDTTSGTNFGAHFDPTTSAKPTANLQPAASSVSSNDVDASSSLPTPPPSEAAIPSASSQLRKADASGISAHGAAAPKKSSLDAQRFSLDQPAQVHNEVRVESAARSNSDPADLPVQQSNPSSETEKLQSKDGKEGGRVKGLVQRVKGRLSIHKDKNGTTGH